LCPSSHSSITAIDKKIVDPHPKQKNNDGEDPRGF
jgi:hypothetical protein